jgi:hypothetical protein
MRLRRVLNGLRHDVASRPVVDLLVRAIAIGVLAVLIFLVLPVLIASAG